MNSPTMAEEWWSKYYQYPPGLAVTVKGTSNPVPPAGEIFPEHLSGPGPGQSAIAPLASKSRRNRWAIVSLLMRLNEMVSPCVTVIVGFARDGLVRFHP